MVNEVLPYEASTKTNADQAYFLILNKIITAEMEPGSLIQEPVLMEQLNLGRTPIREAFKRLETQGFVTVSPRRGMFITPITIKDINRIYEIRIELESLAVRLAADRISSVQLRSLQQQVEYCKNKKSKSAEEMVMMDREFHFMTYEATRNQLLVTDLQRYYYLSQRIWYYGLNNLEPLAVGLSDHFDIVSAFKLRQTELADEIIRRHISKFQKTILEHLV
jgi:DNA-binding GntR family transcriptional regulator